jgi:putative nucleotidyltransferase with HDIG domain
MGPVRPAADLLHEARGRERSGCIPEAIEAYAATIAVANQTAERTVMAEALRRLSILRYRRDEFAEAQELCRKSYQVAQEIGNQLLAAEAMNTMGAQALTSGSLEEARKNFLTALELGGESRELRARVDQNLGILANIQGDLDEASTRYALSLDAYRSSGDEHGCALAYHNMGMVSRHRGRYDEADRYFRESHDIAERAGDVYLQGLCLASQAEVQVARQRFEEAKRVAESALVLFDQLGSRGGKADAYRILGVVYRETGRPALAESRLRSAIEMAIAAGSSLNQAEASRDLALVYQTMGRNQEALGLLNTAHTLFSRLDARVDLINVTGKMEELEGTFLAVVREWGQSIESSDSYTHGHCERVAENAVAVARALGLDEQEQTTIRLGAYLHDVGKVRVPHEILNKPGPLTRDEFEVVQMHTVWGIELLEGVEFPWDIKPIIRWHHEKYDGTGYPDRLRGEEIPVAAQVVGVVDVYDALTTTRAYRAALSPAVALQEITRCRGSWSVPVFEAFTRVVDQMARQTSVQREQAAA